MLKQESDKSGHSQWLFLQSNIFAVIRPQPERPCESDGMIYSGGGGSMHSLLETAALRFAKPAFECFCHIHWLRLSLFSC
jgi:hypothetical protein